jgi:hypothetical protein
MDMYRAEVFICGLQPKKVHLKGMLSFELCENFAV